MYTLRVIHFPALGKGPELSAALNEWSSAPISKVFPFAISTSLFAPEPAYVNAVRLDTLAAWDDWTGRHQSDSVSQACMTRVMACMSRPQIMQLSRVLIPVDNTRPPKVVLRGTRVAAPGQGPALRAAMEAQAEAGKSRPGVIGSGLSQSMVSLEGPTFSWTVMFDDLAGVEQFLDSMATQPGAVGAQANAAAASPLRQRWFRVLKPFPAS
jgi:hypothetical protein